MKRYFIASAFCMATILPAHAQFKASDLRLLCDEQGGKEAGQVCRAWINGFAGGLLSAQSLAHSKKIKPSTCLPDGIDENQIQTALVRFMESHQDALGEDVTVVASVALDQAFPCPKSN
jgi:hypothetical protein